MSPTSWCNFHRHVHSQSQTWCTANWQPVEDEIQISDTPPLWESAFQEYLLFTRQVSLMLDLQIMDTNISSRSSCSFSPDLIKNKRCPADTDPFRYFLPIRSCIAHLMKCQSSYGSQMKSETEMPASELFLDTFLMQNQAYKTNQDTIRRVKGS